MNLPNIKDLLGKVFTGSTSTLVDSVKGVIDESKYSAEEKAEMEFKLTEVINNYKTKEKELATKELEVILADTANAREANTRIQESDKASWLAKNVAYILDLFLGTIWGTITVILFLKIFKIAASDVDMVSLMALHGTVTAVFMIVVNFHRGTSRGSEDKQRHIEKLTNLK